MQFTTPVPIAKGEKPIDHTSRIVSLGSCFAVNMGQKLDYFKFKNVTNPFGILFHPLALQKFINLAINKTTFNEADIFYHNERWHCFDAHSDLSHPDNKTLLANLNTAVTIAHANINQATHVIITLGTAWVYRNNATNALVANCHKVPQKEFTKELLSVSAIKDSLKEMIRILKVANPDVQVIFTLSPVRHIKDGYTENQWSKANLMSALQEVLATPPLGLGGLSYFPSYEIMMDELRDYRFYAEDMIHPSQTAIDYIWERFTNTWISTEAQSVMKEVEVVQKGLQHRSFNPDSAQHKAFLSKIDDKITALQKQYPHLAF